MTEDKAMADDAGLRKTHPARDIPPRMADRLIVALDVPTVAQARQLVSQLDGVVSFFKIGLWLLFAKETDPFIQDLIDEGKDIFLDYKMYDIGETVKEGVKRAAERGVKFITVHGDPAIIRSAMAGKGTTSKLKVFAITVLTSLADQNLAEMGYTKPVKDVIRLRVKNAIENGCDGIIASASDHPDEIRFLGNAQHLLIATPGIRQPGESTDDHQRFARASYAIEKGSDYLVVGRPIIKDSDPRRAALAIIEDMERGEEARKLTTPAAPP